MSKRLKVVNQIPAVTNKSNSKTLDINLYGPVIDSAGWFYDEKSVITPGRIQSVLNDAGNVSQINVHLNSPGGSVFAGQAIHNMLRQHPANVTIYIDGLAASIASIIAMAGNKIVMPPGTMMMIHNPLLSLWGSYFASEMREMADFLDKIKESLVATYVSKCTKKTKDEIMAIMDATTWYTAADAVENGFADEIEGSEVSAEMNGKVMNIAGMAFDLSAFANIPMNLVAQAANPLPQVAEPKNNKTEEEEILDLNELKAKFPDLYNELFNLGIAQERARMKAIDEVQMAGFEEIINKARYETGASAEQVALQIINTQKQMGNQYLNNRQEDVIASNLSMVPNAPAPNAKQQEDQEALAAAEKIAGYINEGR